AHLRAAHHRDQEAGDAPPGWQEEPPARLADSIAAYALWLMDRDRKDTGLKSLQGLVWAEGYRRGRLRGVVYPDVPPALERWRRAGLAIAIFSSGSVRAQQDLFSTAEAGDLTARIDAYFDTATGPKGDPQSYRRIASALGCPAER